MPSEIRALDQLLAAVTQRAAVGIWLAVLADALTGRVTIALAVAAGLVLCDAYGDLVVDFRGRMNRRPTRRQCWLAFTAAISAVVALFANALYL